MGDPAVNQFQQRTSWSFTIENAGLIYRSPCLKMVAFPSNNPEDHSSSALLTLERFVRTNARPRNFGTPFTQRPTTDPAFPISYANQDTAHDVVEDPETLLRQLRI